MPAIKASAFEKLWSSDRCAQVVYFIEAIGLNAIKIGMSRQVEYRFDAIQACCPAELRLLGTVPGSKQLERQLHKRFVLLRVRGEWFSATDGLRRDIEKIVAGEPVNGEMSVNDDAHTTVSKAARFLGRTTTQVKKLVATGDIECRRINGRIRIPWAALRKFSV